LASKVTTWPLQPPNHGSPSPSIFETVPWLELAIQIGSVAEVLPVLPGPVSRRIRVDPRWKPV